jgi:RNA polymerase sigma factor (sigma-70 family)
VALNPGTGFQHLRQTRCPARVRDASLARARGAARKGNPISHNPDIASGGLKAVFLADRPALLRFLAARRVPPEEAEDLVQDLFVKLETQAVGPVAQPRAYLYRMLDNLLLDRRRSAGRRAGREEAWMTARSGPALEVDDKPTAEQQLIDRERLDRVSLALAALPERTLLIFSRFRIDSASQRDIALELGISVSAVEKHLQRAYRVLVEIRGRLDEDAPAPRRL